MEKVKENVPPRVWVYARCPGSYTATKEQAEFLGLRARLSGATVVGVSTDTKSGWNRPGYRELLHRMKQGDFNCIYNRGSYRKQNHKKITGFMALYYHYLYLFGKVQKRRTSSRKTHFLLWEDFRTFERYKQQAQFLWQHGIQTTDDLHQKRQEVTAKMDGLVAKRQTLYKLRSNAANGLNKADLSQQIQALTEELRGLRKELRYCDAIEQDAEHLRKQVETIRCAEQEAEQQKAVVG